MQDDTIPLPELPPPVSALSVGERLLVDRVRVARMLSFGMLADE